MDPTANESWKALPAFAALCDYAFSGRLVCMTGAGISQDLKRKKGGTLPGWVDLLKEIRDGLFPDRAGVGDAERDILAAVDAVLTPKSKGEDLILAAGLLEEGREQAFDDLLRAATTTATSQDAAAMAAKQRLHDAILALRPRGIVTLNYDDGHDRALEQRGLVWLNLNPTEASDSQFAQIVARDFRDPFLLHAHGSIESTGFLVLTFRSYREIISKNPAYKAFMDKLLTDFHIMFVGFGLSDLDFDLFVRNPVLTYGKPVRRHVAIAKQPKTDDVESQLAAFRGRQYGIDMLYVPAFDEIPHVIRAASETPGPLLQKLLAACIAETASDRSRAHDDLANLPEQAKAIGSTVLRRRIEDQLTAGLHGLDPNAMWIFSEWVYSLGCVRPIDAVVRRANKDLLLQVLEVTHHTEPAAHALLVLHHLLTVDDLPTLDRITDGLLVRPLVSDDRNPDPETRIPTFVKALRNRVRARDLHRT